MDKAVTLSDAIAFKHGIRPQMVDRSDPLELQAAWKFYQVGGDDRYSKQEFYELTRQVRALHFFLMSEIDETMQAGFGIELWDGGGTNCLYFAAAEGRRDVMKRCAEPTVAVIEDIAVRWAGIHGVKPELLLIGRPGWKRILRRLGIVRQSDGLIFHDQERFQ